jgi:acyl-CoA reductase-like NAD-dependent aldehyde dehydrogenase
LRFERRRLDRQEEQGLQDREQTAGGDGWANTCNKFDPTSPFGGYKESGFGREGGRHGLMPYVTLN